MPHDVPAGDLARAARRLNDASSWEEALDAIVHAARTSVPGADHVGLTRVRPDGRPETLAATGDRARELDELQYALGDGPCLTAIAEDTAIHVPDLREEGRWSAFVEQAAARGLRSQIGVTIFSDREGRCGLNIYADREPGLTAESAETADVLAAQAALALGKARAIGQLEEGMRSRQRIGVAVGILMQRYSMSEERAFAYLVRESSHGNMKLRDVAADVVRDFKASLEG